MTERKCLYRFCPPYGCALCKVRALQAAQAQRTVPLPADVSRLVIAARKVAFDAPTPENASAEYLADWQRRVRELDQASEAFADRVEWDDAPDADEHRTGEKK